MQYDDELQSLRHELDDLLNRAAGMKDRIAAIERELRLESVAQAVQPPVIVPDEPIATATPKMAVPPPLPVAPVMPVVAAVEESVQETPAPVVAAAKQPLAIPPVPVRVGADKLKPQESIEQRIGTYWLPRIGGVLLALAVGWLMVLGAQYSTPFTRVLGGYALFVALMITGWRLEKNYLQYARVLYAIGIAISYFVTFAAHYIEPARIVESETIGVTALICVVAGWGVVAQIRNSKIVATLVTLLGHLTMALAFFTSGDLARYSIVGVAVLGFGSAFFLLWNRWYYVAVIGLVGCYVNHAIWTSNLTTTTPEADFNLSFGMLCVYMLTFSLSELFCAEDLRRSKIPTNFRSLYVTANTATFFLLAELTIRHYPHVRPHQDVFQFIYAGVLGLIALGYLRLRGRDPLYNVYMTKAVAMFTLGMAVRYGQGTLTASLAVETVVLLYSARRSGMVVTRLLAFAVALLCVAQAAYTLADVGRISSDAELYWRRLVEAGFAVAAMLVASQLYQRTDWSVRSPKTMPFSRETLCTLWDLDLIAEAPKGREQAIKPFGGLQFPYLYAVGGFSLFLMHTYMLTGRPHAIAILSAFVLIMTVASSLLSSRPYSLVAMLGLVPVALSSMFFFATYDNPPVWLAWVSVAMVMAAAVQADRTLSGTREGLAFHQMAASPFLLYCTVSFMLSTAFIAYGGTNLRAALFLTVASGGAAALTTLLHRRAVATAALMLLVFAVLSWIVQADESATFQWHSIGIFVIAVALVADRFYAATNRGGALAPWGAVSVGLAWFIAMRYADALGNKPRFFEQPEATAVGYGYYGNDWKPFAWALVSYAFAGYAAITRSRTSIAVAGFGALFASCAMVSFSFEHAVTLWPLVCGYVSLAVFWGICERLVAHIKDEKTRPFIDGVCAISVALASVLMVLMIAKIPSIAGYFLTAGWAVLAFALFGVSLLTAQKFYRYAGLAIFFLATARLFKDAWELTGFYRPLAFIVVSALMLIVSFGYYHASRLIDARKKDE